MRLLDLSQTLDDGSPGSPDYPRPRIRVTKKLGPNGWRIEMLTAPSHCGTHLDMPAHRLRQWKRLQDFPLETFVGAAHLVDLRGIAPGAPITPELLKPKLPAKLEDRIVLLGTGWAQKRGHTDLWYRDLPYLAPDGASYLVEQGVRGVGIDHWSIGGSADPHDTLTHMILMGANRWIVENLELGEEVFQLPQPLRFWALPIKFSNKVSGCFCRAVVLVE